MASSIKCDPALSSKQLNTRKEHENPNGSIQSGYRICQLLEGEQQHDLLPNNAISSGKNIVILFHYDMNSDSIEANMNGCQNSTENGSGLESNLEANDDPHVNPAEAMAFLKQKLFLAAATMATVNNGQECAMDGKILKKLLNF